MNVRGDFWKSRHIFSLFVYSLITITGHCQTKDSILERSFLRYRMIISIQQKFALCPVLFDFLVNGIHYDFKFEDYPRYD